MARVGAVSVLGLVASLLTGCGTNVANPTIVGGPETDGPTATPATTRPMSTTTPRPASPFVINADFEVADDGRSLHLWCVGTGSPTIVLEAGHPIGGFDHWLRFGRAFTNLLAEERRVCAYDRAGYGASDPPPDGPRTLDDTTDDLHAVLEAAEITGPLVLVGASFGGMIVTYYTHRFPEGIVGVVLLDVPAPSATLNLEDEPGLAWDHPSNPEHVDVVPEFENRLAAEQFPFEAPLLVITATDGQSDVDDQSFWLEWSDSSRQIELPGEHDVYQRSPNEIRDEILKFR